jgi:hypothetical protein
LVTADGVAGLGVAGAMRAEARVSMVAGMVRVREGAGEKEGRMLRRREEKNEACD